MSLMICDLSSKIHYRDNVARQQSATSKIKTPKIKKSLKKIQSDKSKKNY